MSPSPLFADRTDAGRQLAERLAPYRGPDVVVLALPRGGVPIAAEVARALDAPLDVVVARKVGAPGHPEFGVGAVAPGGVLLLNRPTVEALGLTEADLAPIVERERAEMDRRLRRYRGDGTPDVRGRTVVLVDDGLATGVTAAAAVEAIRRGRPRRIVLAVPVCSPQAAEALAETVDAVVCVARPADFRAVGMWYRDFDQSSDAEVVALLREARERTAGRGARPVPDPAPAPPVVRVEADGVALEGDLVVPEDAHGVILFAHGSGSSRHSPRNRAVAQALQEAGLATLLLDLLTPDEGEVDERTRHLRFDVPLLARRLAGAMRWLAAHDATSGLAVGLFGASTGGGAALVAAAEAPDRVRAVVSRGGRPDLAGDALARVEAPTLLVVGGRDPVVLDLNRQAMARMARAEVTLHVVPRASHLFEEPGALEEVARVAAAFFRSHLGGDPGTGRGRLGAGTEVYRAPADVAALVTAEAEPLDLESPSFDALLDRIGDARVVCIGEATHGTSEFYAVRARLTEALVEQKGFQIVAAEADWPDAERVDAYVRHRDLGETERQAFSRFPTWMWRNAETLRFVEWLRDWNDGRPDADRAGFFGLDLYSLYTSVGEVLRYLDGRDPALAETARERYACLAPFAEDPALYSRALVSGRYRACETEAVAVLQDLLASRLRLTARGDGRAQAFPFFDAAQNARLVRDAEAYYRAMYYGSVATWNLRDAHMTWTLRHLLDFFGERAGAEAKAVVWAHNSHLGDAAATQMGSRGEVNVGHLCRQAFGDDAVLIGFGTHAGTVLAAQ